MAKPRLKANALFLPCGASFAGNNAVKEVRGLGMMIAAELYDDAPSLVSDALSDGLLINVTQGNIVRLLPPLNMSDQEADELVISSPIYSTANFPTS